MEEKKRIAYLDAARALAIVSITLNHAVNRAYRNYSGQMEEFQNSSWASTLVKAGATVFSHLGVPLFLMISGILLLRKSFEEKQALTRYYRHNLLSLLLTSEIWYAIMYWFILLCQPGVTTLADDGIRLTLLGMLKNAFFLDQVTLGNMWYIPVILGVYLLVPILAVAVKRLPKQALIIPMAFVFLRGMLFRNINDQIGITGGVAFVSPLSTDYVFSTFVLYLLVGYFLGCGALEKLRDWAVILLASGSFLLCIAYQVYVYAQPVDYSFTYDFAGFLICAVFLLELLRRKVDNCPGFVRYLSKISFGIFFVHIILMELLNWNMDFSGWHKAVKMGFLWVTSFGGSVGIIWLLSHFKIFRKYFFHIN